MKKGQDGTGLKGRIKREIPFGPKMALRGDTLKNAFQRKVQHMDEALQFAKSIIEPENRDEALKNIALSVGKSGDIEKALIVINQIKSRDKREYVLSRLVNILCRLGEFEGAKEIINTIREPGYRKDAIGYTVKVYLESDQWNAVFDFVDRIKQEGERVNAAKIILHHAISNRQEEKIKLVREHFKSSN